MRLMISMILGLLIACGDKEAEDTAVEAEEEVAEEVEAEEVDADGYADTLASDIDMYKAMKIEEARLRRKYRKLVREARKVRKNKNLAKKRILRKLK